MFPALGPERNRPVACFMQSIPAGPQRHHRPRDLTPRPIPLGCVSAGADREYHHIHTNWQQSCLRNISAVVQQKVIEVTKGGTEQRFKKGSHSRGTKINGKFILTCLQSGCKTMVTASVHHVHQMIGLHLSPSIKNSERAFMPSAFPCESFQHKTPHDWPSGCWW